MVFSSLFFVFCFLPIIFLAYFLCKGDQIKNIILILFSLVFYAWGEPIWFVLLIISAVIDYLNGLFVEKHKNTAPNNYETENVEEQKILELA